MTFGNVFEDIDNNRKLKLIELSPRSHDNHVIFN